MLCTAGVVDKVALPQAVKPVRDKRIIAWIMKKPIHTPTPRKTLMATVIDLDAEASQSNLNNCFLRPADCRSLPEELAHLAAPTTIDVILATVSKLERYYFYRECPGES